MARQQCKPAAAAAFKAATRLVILLSVTALTAAASQVPTYEPEEWNKAFIIKITNLTEHQAKRLTSDFNKEYCSTDFDSYASKAAVDDCFYTREADGTYSYWRKYPGDWRDDSNCYCYAVNVYKGGFCLPGAANGTDKLLRQSSTVATCELMRAAVVADGAKEVSKDQALAGQPSSGHYIAITVRNDSCNPYHCWDNDFHALRKDSSGLWSWKEPAGPAGDHDIFGNKIHNPESAIVNGHYDQFCGYFNVFPDSMTIGGTFNEDTLQDQVEYLRQSFPGATVTLQASTPYNATVDAAYDASEQRLINQDLLWESKRGSKEWVEFYQGMWAREAANNGEGTGTGNGSEKSGVISASGRKMLSKMVPR